MRILSFLLMFFVLKYGYTTSAALTIVSVCLAVSYSSWWYALLVLPLLITCAKALMAGEDWR